MAPVRPNGTIRCRQIVELHRISCDVDERCGDSSANRQIRRNQKQHRIMGDLRMVTVRVESGSQLRQIKLLERGGQMRKRNEND